MQRPRLFGDLPIQECSRSYALDEPIDFARIPVELVRAVRKRQVEFLAGRDMALRALVILAPDRAGSVIGVGAMRQPVWPPGIVGSITHASGHAAAAVAWASDMVGLGIDSEVVMPSETAALVVASICRTSELQWVSGDPLMLTLIFSAKESLYKCLAPLVEQPFGFHDAELVSIDSAAGRFVVRLECELGGAFARGSLTSGRFAIDAPFVHTGIALPRDARRAELMNAGGVVDDLPGAALNGPSTGA